MLFEWRIFYSSYIRVVFAVAQSEMDSGCFSVNIGWTRRVYLQSFFLEVLTGTSTSQAFRCNRVRSQTSMLHQRRRLMSEFHKTKVLLVLIRIVYEEVFKFCPDEVQFLDMNSDLNASNYLQNGRAFLVSTQNRWEFWWTLERFQIFMCMPLFVTNTLFRKIRSCYDVRLAHWDGAVVPPVYV